MSDTRREELRRMAIAFRDNVIIEEAGGDVIREQHIAMLEQQAQDREPNDNVWIQQESDFNGYNERVIGKYDNASKLVQTVDMPLGNEFLFLTGQLAGLGSVQSEIYGRLVNDPANATLQEELNFPASEYRRIHTELRERFGEYYHQVLEPLLQN